MHSEPRQQKARSAADEGELAFLKLLATAIAGRDIGVAHAASGVSSWTNGTSIFVEADVAVPIKLQQLCVQSALLATGSLDPEVLRQLKRHPRHAKRYLAVEGQRALLALEALLPPLMHPLMNRELATRSSTPLQSLEIARGDTQIEAPPAIFGELHIRELLAQQKQAVAASSSDSRHVPRSQQQESMRELADDAQQRDDEEDVASSPVGGGGQLGKLLQKLMQMTRRIRDGGPPGADSPTHWSRSGAAQARVRALQSSAQAESVEALLNADRGRLYPEWDVHRQHYRPDWCSVSEIEAPHDQHAAVDWLEGHGLRRPLARLGMGLDRVRHRAQGDDIDIDAAIDAHIERSCGRMPHENTYIESLRLRRDLSVLVLLDVSGSAAQRDHAGHSIHEQQRRVAAELTTVLYEIGDRVALYAFNSQGRSAVHLMPIKRFDETLDGLVMRRLHSVIPGAYSRLGAAIRHGSSVLIERGGTSRRLLVVLSDGLAYDHGYEPSYGAADARRALMEARRDGVGCLCLSIGAGTDTESLKRVFGSAAHASVPSGVALGPLIGPLFRSALKSSEVRRRAA